MGWISSHGNHSTYTGAFHARKRYPCLPRATCCPGAKHKRYSFRASPPGSKLLESPAFARNTHRVVKSECIPLVLRTPATSCRCHPSEATKLHFATCRLEARAPRGGTNLRRDGLATLSSSQVSLLNLGVGSQLPCGSFHDYAPGFENIGPVGVFQSEAGVLFHHQDSDSGVV